MATASGNHELNGVQREKAISSSAICFTIDSAISQLRVQDDIHHEANIETEVDEEQEDEMSNIILKFSESEDKDTGFILHTTKTGHFIKTTSLNSNQLDLNLRDNDRLLGINGKVVTFWNHWIVLESLKYLLFYTEPSERLSLIIDRQDENGKIDVFEICLTVTRSRDKDNDIEIDIGDAYIEIKSLLKRISYQPRMKCVKFKDLFQCRIRHGARTNCYLKVDAKRNLVMETLTNKDEDFWKFDCYVYHCLKLCESRYEPPTNVFICVLRSCHSFDGQRPYIMAKSCEKVGTMCFRTLELDDRRTEKPDPRFFKISRTATGESLFESLIYKDYYLSWNNLSLKLTKHTSAEMVAAAEYLYECQFEILSDSAIAI